MRRRSGCGHCGVASAAVCGSGEVALRAWWIVLSLVLALDSAPAGAAERRCGWFINPTPGNFFLQDGQAEWTLALQGGDSAEGMDENLPDMSKRGWVETNRSYGYGCACMTVVVDRGQKRITRLLSAEPLPLARCRADGALPRHP